MNEAQRVDSQNTYAQPFLSHLLPHPQSKSADPEVLENCRNITEPSCDVTDKWNDAHSVYVLIVAIYRGDSMPSHCDSSVSNTDSEHASLSLRGLLHRERSAKVLDLRAGLTLGPALCGHWLLRASAF